MELTIIMYALAIAGAVSIADTRVVVRAPSSSCLTPAVLDAGTNVWTNRALHPDPYYREKVEKAAGTIKDVELREKASKIADIGTFVWL